MAYHVGLATHKILIPTPLADNLHPASTPLLALPDHRVVTMEGPDAVAFAHAQFANDVTALAVGQWQWNAWLTPKGRVIALFALLRREEHALLAVLPDYPGDAFAAQLQRFVFRRKLKITGRGDLPVHGSFSAPLHANGSRMGVDNGVLELDLGGAGGPRHWRIGESPDTAGEDADQQWRAADLRHGLPRLPESQREQWTPQQLSLDRLHAYSIKKGCYPGQEIVARTHFLGKAKRALRLLESDRPLHAGATVEAGGTAQGEVVSAAGASRALALAVMPLDAPTAGLSIAGADVNTLPLLDGLAR